MPLPKQKHSKSHRNRRRSHHALKVLKLASCPKCGQAVLPHQVCRNCGSYQNREVIDILAKLTKKEQKKKAKELETQEHEQEHKEEK